MITSSVEISLKGLEQFESAIEGQLTGDAGPMANCLGLWAVRYRSFAQLRFDLYSRGGGDWQVLAVSTQKKRRQGNNRSILKFAILRDTNTLFTALTPTFINSPGAIEERIPYGIVVGYGGAQRYTDTKNKTGRATIADIANFHQSGFLPRLPQRKIIVDPPPALIHQMANDAEKAMASVYN